MLETTFSDVAFVIVFAKSIHGDIGRACLTTLCCACTHIQNFALVDVSCLFGCHKAIFKILAKSVHGQWRYWMYTQPPSVCARTHMPNVSQIIYIHILSVWCSLSI